MLRVLDLYNQILYQMLIHLVFQRVLPLPLLKTIILINLLQQARHLRQPVVLLILLRQMEPRLETVLLTKKVVILYNNHKAAKQSLYQTKTNKSLDPYFNKANLDCISLRLLQGLRTKLSWFSLKTTVLIKQEILSLVLRSLIQILQNQGRVLLKFTILPTTTLITFILGLRSLRLETGTQP